ncbi:non-ribosomal peptide synthetase [Abyssisolibacter fermentans]|uniref:non-ribosomal peptide synthetase n=1 Tax=Abyssisolibacter fermentans TaxID=1766203 RepID=UPI000832235D|nr:non-ribosomal peptide synthetase [Abyssisolibacter fermentans]
MKEVNDNLLFTSTKFTKQKNYWVSQLSGCLPNSNLLYSGKLESHSKEKDFIEFIIPGDLFTKLIKMSKNSDISLYLIVVSCLKNLLFRYTGIENITIGSPVYKSNYDECYNNIVALRDNIDDEMSFKDCLYRVRETTLKAYENQDYPFTKIVEHLNVLEDCNKLTLFDVMCIFTNIHDENSIIEDTSNMVFSLTKEEKYIKGKVEYSSLHFEKCFIKQMYRHFLNILKEVMDNPFVKIKDLKIISEEEKQQILHNVNDTETYYPSEKTIHELFEEQVEETPDNIAVVYKEQYLTYKELNERANQLARLLRAKGVKSNKIVGIQLERSLDMIIGIIGILKAGGAYLPISSKYPIKRKKAIIEDSDIDILLTTKNLLNTEVFSNQIIDLKDKAIYKEDTTNLINISNPNDLAYVIYTSGTTDKPKGVMIEHKGIVNLREFFKKHLNVTGKDNVLQFHRSSFDGSVWEIFKGLLTGATLHIVSEEIIEDYNKFEQFLNKNEITIASLPPLYANNINPDNIKTLRMLITAGSKSNLKLVNRWKDKVEYINAYGLTETSITATLWKVSDEKVEYKFVPIGRPISNTKIFIADKYTNMQPIGVPGELCISGEGLARGYLNRLDLTEEKFIKNPFIPYERMYRTGDLARLLPDGNIEFLGRLDDQVKVRGFRIELGEIDNHLIKHMDIKEVVTIVKPNKNNDVDLCSFIVSDKELNITKLREYLIERLPDYMIPTTFLQIERIPLTPNNKIDKKALIGIKANSKLIAEYEAPKNEIEEILVGIWQEVLLTEEEIGINNNFFEIGGHSLKAITLSAKIFKELDIEVPLHEIFKLQTIKKLSEYINNAKKVGYIPIESVEKSNYYPASSAQKRVYVLDKLEKENISYNIPTVLELEGKLDKEKFNEAFKKLIKRHESLRTSFAVLNGEVVQKVSKEIEFKINYTNTEEKELDGLVENFIRPFDLSQSPLFRVKLVKLLEDRHVLMIDIHHIVSDGMTIKILIEEFTKLYRGEEVASLRIQYKDYSVWQKEVLGTELFKRQEQYWLDRFKGDIPVFNLPTDYPRPPQKSFEGESINFKVSKEVADKLYKIARKNKTSLYMVLLAAYNILLYKYTGQEDIIVGTPITGRTHADIQNLVGMFVNTLAMRNHPEGTKTFEELLLEVKENALKAYENQSYQFEDLVEKLPLIRDLSRTPLFDTMFVVQNIDIRPLEIEGLKIKPYNIKNKTSKFDITLTAIETEEGINFNLGYCTRLYKKETMERFKKHFVNIIYEIIKNTQCVLNEIEILLEEEKRLLLHDFNNTETEFSKDKLIHQLFEDQVERGPDNIAIVFEDKYVTYKELNNKSNQLARLLREEGVKSDTIIGIMTERSVEMIIGIMAILKAGGAYFPIDSNLPKDRIIYMLEDSTADILLTQGRLMDKVEFKGEIINLEDKRSYTGDSRNLDNINKHNDLAYIIYTSGSTGKPKGVKIEHINFLNLTKGITNKIEFLEHKTILAVNTISFDLFTNEILVPLANGLRILLASKDQLNAPELLKKFIAENNVDMLIVTPSRLKLLTENGNHWTHLKKLKELMIGGEILSKELFESIKNNLQTRIYNLYGPTEATVWSTVRNLTNETEINIGTPILNTQIYIVDKYNNLQPLGISGELCISGLSLARGYLNRPELTVDRFVENPFIEGEKMYKTGDLARWLPDGNIEFLGRIDNQVKIRGYRIELEEIESILLKHEDIKESVVITKGESDKYLCAYIVSDRSIEVRELREYLLSELPQYMVPSYFIQIDKIPLTFNGKIDRKSLLEIDENVKSVEKYVGPRNEIEEILVGIWQQVLSTKKKIGINDNFFELGGHSLKAVTILSKISEELDTKIPLQEVFGNQTINELAKYILYALNKYEGYFEKPVLLNNMKPKKIFCFPGVLGFGIVFRKLADLLDDFSIYAFNFIDSKNIITKYVDDIINIQKEGPYILLAYSAGGALTFEVAKELEKRGHMVCDIILFDCYRRDENEVVFQYEDDMLEKYLMDNIEKGKKYILTKKEKEIFREEIVEKINKYQNFYNNLYNFGTVSANIHFLVSTSMDESKVYKMWDQFTSKDYKIYRCFGDHNEMLTSPYLEKNTSIIKKILEKKTLDDDNVIMNT